MKTGNSHVLMILLLAGAGFSMMQHPATAAEERRIMAQEIHQLLANAKVTGEGYEQTFGDPRGHDSASTTYWEGNNPSYGRWRVSADKYCSQWGNPEFWSCYEVRVIVQPAETAIIWLDESGRRFEGVIVEE